MRYDRDGIAVEVMEDRGVYKTDEDYPKWYRDKPNEEPIFQFFITSFWTLSTGRSSGSGRISWSDIVAFCRWRGLNKVNTDLMVHVITSMDAELSEWQAAERARGDGSKTVEAVRRKR